MKILEIGPGSGFYTFDLARYAGQSGHVYAVDIEPKMVAILEKKIKQEGIKNITPKVASAYEVPLLNNSVERVFMGGVLAEISDKQKALREAWRVLREGGLLANMECLIDPDYPQRKTVIHWCEDVGFELVESHGSTFLYLLIFKLKDRLSGKEDS